MLTTIPAQYAFITAYLGDKLPQPKDERGANTLEMAIIIVAVIAVVAILVTAITAAVQKHTGEIR